MHQGCLAVSWLGEKEEGGEGQVAQNEDVSEMKEGQHLLGHPDSIQDTDL